MGVPYFAFFSPIEQDSQTLWQLLATVHDCEVVAMVGRYEPDGSRRLLVGVAPWWVILAGLTALGSQTHPTGDLLQALRIYAEATMSDDDFSGIVVPDPGPDSTELT
jgi:hypothetical protein